CSANDIWSITWRGEVLKSSNGGVTWESTGLYDYWPVNISALSNSNVRVVGWDGKISYYDGTIWTAQTSGTTADLYDVCTLNATNIYSVGAEKFLFSGGSTWTARTGGTTENLNAVSAISQDSVWAVGANGTVAHTTNGGQVWAPQTFPTGAHLNGVSALNSTFAWAVGWNAALTRGELVGYHGTWDSVWSIANIAINGVSMATTKLGWAVGASGYFFKFTVTGPNEKWTASVFSAYPNLYGVCALGTYAWLVGEAGGVGWGAYTTNSGTAWYLSSLPGGTGPLKAVDGVATNDLWAVGDNGTILHSTGGASWSADPQSGVITTQHLYGVSAAAANRVWAVGANGTVLLFDGTSWSVQESPTTVQLNGVSAFDSSNIWAVGNGGTILFADPPYIKYCYPTWGNPGQTLTVEVVGAYTHFDGSSVVDFGEGITVVPGSLQILDYTKLRVQITIAPDAARGPRDIGVVTGAEEAVPLAGGFMVGPDPAITGVGTSCGLPGWTGDVLIDGSETHFDLSGQASFGEGIAVNYIKDIQPDKATANITISPNASLGERDVNLITGGETPRALSGGFTVINTPEGTDVKLNLDSATTVEFDRVTSAGITTSGEKPDPGTDGYLVVRGTCRDVSTTATYSGNVRVTLSYPDSGFSPEEESRLVILHEESGNWVDRTKSRDTKANRLTAEVGGLSRFVVALPVPGPEEPSELSQWYLAEGTTAWGYNTTSRW
ncbi:MAG: hypothetical protein KKE56_01065, partial [Actinobacteria bacterium]|nr:hypothetical protein [Actinomycetota bacterium]